MTAGELHPFLIVDDEDLICAMLKSRLARLALPGVGEIRTCDSGEAALSMCENYQPHLVLTDIRMGGMDGIALIEHLSDQLSPVRFVVLSGYDEFDLVRRAFTSGAFDYLLKPIVPEALQRVVEAALVDLELDDAPARNNLDALRRRVAALEKIDETDGSMNLTEQIRRYIDEHYATGINLAQVAEHFNVSYSHMSKLFKTHFHMLFTDYLTDVRMHEATRLLTTTQLNVQEVATKCGYDNVFHFSRAFKKHTGVAPSYFRKQ